VIGSNPRREAPVVNARIRKRWLNGKLPVGLVGEAAELTYDAERLGTDAGALSALHDPSGGFGKILADAKKPMVIVGQAALRQPGVLAAAWQLAGAIGALTGEWHGFNVLHTAASRVGALDLGFLPGQGGRDFAGMLGGGVDVLWLLGADEFDPARIGPKTFVIYQGHHGDRGASRADVILPGSAYTEKSGTYVNTEGRVQRGLRAVYPPGEAREDWKIIRAFSDVVGKTLPYDDLAGVRARLVEVNPVFGRVNFLPRFGASDQAGPSAAGDGGRASGPFGGAIQNYYQTDPISRASATMAECTATFAATPLLQAAE
jgi:NADH-quinone oxidoreductase subunit G